MRSNRYFARFAPFAGLAAAGHAVAQADFPAVFLVHNVSDSVVAYQVGADGRPVQAGSLDVSDWPTDIALSPGGSRLAVTHATSSSNEILTIIAVGPDGALTKMGEFGIPDSPLAADWLADDLVAVTSSTFGASSFRVYRYSEDPAPSLTLLDTESPGGFATALEPDLHAGLLYVNDSVNNVVRVYAINADGTVDALTLSGSGGYPIDIKLTPDKLSLYGGGGISGDGHRIVGFDLDPSTGGIGPMPGSPFHSPGQSPAYLCAPSGGDYLIVGHGTDATVRTFAIDPDDGSLEYTGFTFDVGLQGTIGDIVELNGFVFITDESTSLDDIYGLYSFILNADGTMTQNGPVLETPGTRPETMVVWNPAPSCPADFNGDGEVNTLDVLAFLNAWSAGDPSGDFNGDGEVNTLDVLAFLNAWTAGC
ncbi:MAG TPA: GC-type dockerin domain-anchored protein [Phycisphaerales bacterium]|nr:GC-type dockerin domain-anchored protein [Phycisphaerales bacterium]